MTARQKYQGAPWLYDEVTPSIILTVNEVAA